MKKFVYFLMVVLTFTVFQVATVGADEVDISHCAQFEGEPKVACEAAAHGAAASGAGEDCAGMPTPTEVAACWERQSPAAATSAVTETAIRSHAMKTAATCVEAVNEAYDLKRSIHFGTDSPPFPPRGADGKDNERIDAQQEIELEKCQECPTMWSVADKRLETGVAGTHIGSGTVTCLPPAGEAAVAPGAK
ncbi:uncharacterized protein METZ01_LOCUS351823 [marine metagenome]|uniref:Uncharacterized protein n=1 Tax=marine metagenome TaxID=408172 RepID=A0A382RMQ6_9ZZZZ